MSKVIALFNMSGGVAKSTLTVNLGYHLAQDEGKKVLLIDMDPQASLTTFLGFSPFEVESTVNQGLLSKQLEPISAENVDCDLVAANIYLAQAELQLASELRREYRLADALSKISDSYDVILIDCPPSLGLLSINCLVAADYLLIPIQTEYKSVEATINLLQTAYEIAQEVNPKLKIMGAIPTMFDRTSQSKRALQTIAEVFQSLQENPSFNGAVVFNPVPRRTDFANATASHLPLAKYAPRHEAISQIQDIAKAIKKVV